MRLRIFVSVVIAVASGTFCWFLLSRLHQGAADFTWAVRAAQSLLAQKNPYDTPLEQYPLTAALFGLPFVRMPPEIAAAAFYGIGSGLMAFGLSRHGYFRLLVFLAFPYWAGILTAQWCAMIFASAFFPILLPAVMAKPQIGLPIALTRMTRTGFIACVIFFAATLIVMPHWPLWWLRQLGYYQHFIPVLVLPGPLLILSLLRYRDRDARFLLLMAIMPQRWFFDTLTLWLIPQTRRELTWTVFLSWVPGIWRWYHVPLSYAQAGRWTVIFIYLPMLAVVLLRASCMRKSLAKGWAVSAA
ncbi:MAG: hypothetical protein M3O09_01250 [Acidobacteriota bacterium]|nr:hypothetical protein [Acidobacteriota bacterium]